MVVNETDPRAARHARRVTIVKWALMLTAVFWVLVYRAAEEDQGVPEFVYVNF